MKSQVTFAHRTVVLVLLATVALAFLASCDRITGDTSTNSRPEVFFVNVPPDNHSTSFDPVVYWIGSDQDGLVEFFRYIVVREDQMGGQTPDVYRTTTLPNMPDSMWVRLDVTPDDPQTTNIIPMSASLDDPVNTYVLQYIFVQCFDDEGLGSVIEYKLFQRNDNPPESEINLANMTYINSVNPGGVITGVRFQLEGDDPDEADSLFEFQWKVFGPFESDTTVPDGGEWGRFQADFLRQVFVTNDARVFFYGDNLVDTIIEYRVTGTGIDTIETILLIDTITENNFYGQLDSVFDIEAFQLQDTEGKAVDSSFNGSDNWVSNNRNFLYRDSLYNLFRNDNEAFTRSRKFLMWAQTRDGAEVADVTPSYLRFEVVDPQYERDVLLIDFTGLFGRINAPYQSDENDVPRDYWKTVIDNWSANEQGGAVSYDRDNDYVDLQRVNGELPLDVLLAYKVVILYSDNVQRPPNPIEAEGNITTIGAQMYTAIDAGVNVWATWRCPLAGTISSPPAAPLGQKVETIFTSSSFQQYFGVSEMAYSGWAYYARTDSNQTRIEDFIGAAPLSNAVGWPELPIDTGQLHQRYFWRVLSSGRDSTLSWTPHPGQKPDSTVFGLPDVDWSVRVSGTEPLYLYTSAYGPRHPAGNDFAFDGTPVAIRLETPLYRTVHFNFTPVAMLDDSMQVVIDTVLNWLYDSSLRTPTAATRYPGARIQLSVDQARAMAMDRREREAEMFEALRSERSDSRR